MVTLGPEKARPGRGETVRGNGGSCRGECASAALGRGPATVFARYRQQRPCHVSRRPIGPKAPRFSAR